MIIHSNLSKKKNPTCLQGNFRDSLGKFSNTSCGIFGVERVKASIHVLNTEVYNNPNR